MQFDNSGLVTVISLFSLRVAINGMCCYRQPRQLKKLIICFVKLDEFNKWRHDRRIDIQSIQAYSYCDERLLSSLFKGTFLNECTQIQFE